MSCHHSRARLAITVCLVTLVALSLSGCGKTDSWTEQVVLHNGHILLVHGEDQFSHTDFSGNSTIVGERFHFRLPGTDQAVVWKMKFDHSYKKNSLNVGLIDIVKGTPYLVAVPAGCIAYNKWGRPNPPYITFKYQAGQWHRIPLTELPAVLVHSNLWTPGDPKTAKSYYSAADVRKLFNEMGVPKEARTISRKPYQTQLLQCPVLVPVTRGPSKGGWQTPGSY